MITHYDLAKLNSMLRDFYNLTHIRIAVFDEHFNELAVYPKEKPAVCTMIRSIEEGDKACIACDKDACSRVLRTRKSFTYTCHAGLTESITPIMVGDIISGYLIFGQIFRFDSVEEGYIKIRQCCENLHLNNAILRQACNSMDIIDKEYISSASHILQAVAGFLYMDHMVTLNEIGLQAKIDEYLKKHYTEDINAANIAKQFGIGKTKLYDISKEMYGSGIAKQIKKLRIEKAETLLKNRPDLSIAEVAEQCGYSDYNYFITVFKSYTNTTPKAYVKAQM